MPVLQLLSDLHLEFLRTPRAQAEWIDALNPEGVDVLILAGDICLHREMDYILPRFAQRFPQVVYVTGNHEYYKSSPDAVHGTLWDIEVENKNFTWLHNRAATVAGLKFVGGTLWFPRPHAKADLLKYGLNDYRMIEGFEPWVYEENAICKAVLGANGPTADVIVTHHMASASFVSPRYRVGPNAAMNHFFCDDLTRQIEEWQPTLVCFGHTHDRKWIYIKDTKVVCNPLGYPHEREFEERGSYAPRCLIEISQNREGTLAHPTISPAALFREDQPGG